ncbi:MAG: hypothetical protein Q4B14_04685, partial [Clostridia bacterium]|nr:hypothetical protein [Clostridia bacterium]
SSKYASSAVSLLPEKSSKDSGEVNSQNWDELLGLINSDVSSGVFTFAESAADNAGGEWLIGLGISLICLGTLGVFLVIYFQYFSPKSPGKIRKMMIAKTYSKPATPEKNYYASSSYASAYQAAYKKTHSRPSGSTTNRNLDYGDSYNSYMPPRKK